MEMHFASAKCALAQKGDLRCCEGLFHYVSFDLCIFELFSDLGHV